MYSKELATMHFIYGFADGNALEAHRLPQEQYPTCRCLNRKTIHNNYSPVYKAFLQNKLADFLDDVPLIFRQELHFMHDDAAAHFSLLVCKHLDEMFPGKWIDRGGSITWLTRFKPIELLSMRLCKIFSVFTCSGWCRNSSRIMNYAAFQTIRATPEIWNFVFEAQWDDELRLLDILRQEMDISNSSSKMMTRIVTQKPW